MTDDHLAFWQAAPGFCLRAPPVTRTLQHFCSIVVFRLR